MAATKRVTAGRFAASSPQDKNPPPGGSAGRVAAETFMFAIISDIHGNLEALQAVLADIDARGIQRTVCLGDVIGYGASPKECIDLVVERCEFCLCGNHDHAV